MGGRSGRGEGVRKGVGGERVKGREWNRKEGGCLGNGEGGDDEDWNGGEVWKLCFVV